MITVKFLIDDIEGIRDFGILLFQNGYIYRMAKEKNMFVLFHIIIEGAAKFTCSVKLDEKNYCPYTLSVGDNPVINFKAFGLVVY